MSPLKTFLFSCWAADPSIQIYQNIFVTPLSREFPINFIFARLLLQMVAPNYCQTPDYLKPSSCQIAADKNKTHIAKYGVFRRRCTIIINEVIVSVFLLNPVKAHLHRSWNVWLHNHTPMTPMTMYGNVRCDLAHLWTENPAPGQIDLDLDFGEISNCCQEKWWTSCCCVHEGLPKYNHVFLFENCR